MFALIRFCLLFLPFVVTSVKADVVKPALIEISAYTDGKLEVEIRTSIEALLTGINAKYKNTRQAPTAKQYDKLRILPPEQLGKKFGPFQNEFLNGLELKVDQKKIILKIINARIPEPGYPKVPRISVINLSGEIPVNSKELIWHYPEKFGDNAVRVRQVDKAKQKWHWSEWQWLKNDKASAPFSLAQLFIKPSIRNTVLSYVVIGFEHIVPRGTDHILFILGLFLFSSRLKPLLWQVTMFTLAHTITLALSMYKIIALPDDIVEPLIALSIAYVGFENVFAKNLSAHRLWLVFGFGLLHGLGFAGVLAEFGMPENRFATALISFNLGVELGQLFIILCSFLLIGFWFGKKTWYRKILTIPLSLLISLLGIYWALERMLLI